MTKSITAIYILMLLSISACYSQQNSTKMEDNKFDHTPLDFDGLQASINDRYARMSAQPNKKDQAEE